MEKEQIYDLQIGGLVADEDNKPRCRLWGGGGSVYIVQTVVFQTTQENTGMQAFPPLLLELS